MTGTTRAAVLKRAESAMNEERWLDAIKMERKTRRRGLEDFVESGLVLFQAPQIWEGRKVFQRSRWAGAKIGHL